MIMGDVRQQKMESWFEHGHGPRGGPRGSNIEEKDGSKFLNMRSAQVGGASS